MRKLAYPFIIAVLIISGCAFSANNDEQNINGVIESFSELTLSAYESGEETDYAKESISTLLWYRSRDEEQSADYTLEIDVEGDSAFVEISGVFPGVMNLFSLDSIGDTIHTEKDFSDSLKRYAVLKKDTLKEYHGGWRLEKITDGCLYTSSGEVKIDSVRIKGSTLDTLITDVFGFFARDGIIKFGAGEEVTTTLYTSDSSSVFFVHSNMKRGRLTGSDGVLSRTWTAPLAYGRYRLAFDGMTYETLYDDSIPYSAKVWVLPYIVE